MLNSDIQGINMRQSSNFHQAISDLTLYQKGTYHIGLKAYNRLPAYIKNISHSNKVLKLLLKNVLYSKPFYKLHEYFRYNNI